MELLSFVGPILSGLAAFAGVLVTGGLMSYRVEQLEKHFGEFSQHIEHLITIQNDVDNIKEDIDEFKSKESADRKEIRGELEHLRNDITEIKEQSNDMKIIITQIQGKVENLSTVINLMRDKK